MTDTPRGLVLALLLFAGCGGVSQSVTTPALKPASALGAYTEAQLTRDQSFLKSHPCAEGAGWLCGIVLAEGKTDDQRGDGWVAIVVRPSGVLAEVFDTLDLDPATASIEFPPGVTIRWLPGNDEKVTDKQISVVS